MIHTHPSEAIKIFFSLAPEDQALFEELRKHLMLLKRRGLIDMQYDSMITAGSDTASTIQSFIRTADIIVLLISSDFFASDQCAEVEMPCALAEHTVRAAEVISVLLRSTAWIGFPLAQHALLPTNGKAVRDWSNQDTAFTDVARGIYRMIEKFAQHLASNLRPVKPPQFPLFTLPHRQYPFFSDREDMLSALHSYFSVPSMQRTRIQAIYGPAGMGKTLLASEYAYRYQKDYQAVLWLRATPATLFSSDILSLARQLGIPAQDNVDEGQRIATIQRWLQRHEKWLLLLDNIEDTQLLGQLIPSTGNGHVLLTTHSHTAENTIQTIQIGPLPEEDAVTFLLRRGGIIRTDLQGTPTPEDYSHALLIAQEVAGYPLALDQAGAYMEREHLSPTAYFNLYQKEQTKRLKRRGQHAQNHPNPTTITLQLIIAKVSQIDPYALDLLNLFAFLSAEELPYEMLRDGAATLKGSLHTLATDPEAFDAALTTLLNFSLVNHSTDSTTISMHHIVQNTLKGQITKKQRLQLARQAIRLINAVFPEVRFDTQSTCARYAHQAQHCAILIQDNDLPIQEGILLLERLGSYYSLHGCYAIAETYLKQALQLQEKYPHSHTTETAQILNSLGLLSQRQGRYEQAENYHAQALAIRQHMADAEHSKITESMHNLALIYGDLGEYQRAEQSYLEIIQLEQRVKGPDHPDIAKTLNNLALMYYHQGNYAQAETTYQQALTIYDQSLPADHPDRIYPLDGLGALAEAEGNYQQAEQFYQQAMSISKQAFGEMHPETAHSLNKLADIAELKRNYREAETLYLQALSIGERVLGPDHPDVALFLNNLAFLVQREGQDRRAEELYEQALNIYEQTLGPDHPDVASVLNNLGKLARSAKDEEKAEKLLRRALAIDEKRLSATHPDIILSLSDLADLLISQRRYEEAETLLQRAWAILLQTTDIEHTEAEIVREQYATLLERMNKKAEAIRIRSTELTK